MYAWIMKHDLKAPKIETLNLGQIVIFDLYCERLYRLNQNFIRKCQETVDSKKGT